MRNLILAASMALALAFGADATTTAYAACDPAVTCEDAVKNKWNDLNHAPTTSGARQRANTGGGVVRECTTCALEELIDQIGKAQAEIDASDYE